MRIKEDFIVVVAFALHGCQAKIEAEEIYGDYSLIINNIENTLSISPDGTYTQGKISDGKLVFVNNETWKAYTPGDDDIRSSLLNFKFPSKKASGEWHAQLEARWGNFSLCYFNDRDISECYVKRKSSER